MIHITCVIKMCTVTVPTNAHKYVEISSNTELLHVSANHVSIFRYDLPKRGSVHCLYKLISIYLCAFVGTVIVFSGGTLNLLAASARCYTPSLLVGTPYPKCCVCIQFYESRYLFCVTVGF
jgi:hypothetical protein